MGIFTFKRFSVCDDQATMKVGTDAVLLGAWVNVAGAKSILDVGTGSGVIALMMAQRTDPDAKVDGIELLERDSQQAAENFLHSPWPNTLSVINANITEFNPGIKYDCIVCNPPFFSKSLLPPTESRSTARHTIAMNSDDLLNAVIRLLAPSGNFCVILPATSDANFIAEAGARQLFLRRLTRFFSRPEKPQERSLMEFGFVNAPPREDSLILYESGNHFTDGYWRLTGDFYLERSGINN